MTRAGGGARGFTLLEVLAATALMAVLAGSLYGTLHVAFKAREAAERSITPVRAVEAAIAMIKEDFESAAGPAGVLAGPFTGEKASELNDGTNDSVSFFASGPAADQEIAEGVGDIRKIEYACDPAAGSGGLALVRRVTNNLLSTQTVEPEQETVCRNVRSLTLRYFDGTTWQETWDSTTQNNVMPTAVEVTLEVNLPGAPPSSRPDDGVYRICRVIPVPCGREATTGTTVTTGGTTPRTP